MPQIDRNESFRDSNKAAIDYSKSSIQFAFLLNGAAATALFSKSGDDFIFSASILAIGAFLATCCMGMSYVVQMFICFTWQQASEPYDFFFWGKLRKITTCQIEWLRTICIGLWVSSMVMCFIGIILAISV